jgi:hypothetical protein
MARYWSTAPDVERRMISFARASARARMSTASASPSARCRDASAAPRLRSPVRFGANWRTRFSA